MHLDSRIGSLEKGKDADFVVLSGDPFSVYSRVLETYIDGKPVFRLSDEKDRRYQVGGFALGDRVKFPAAQTVVQPLPAVKAARRPGEGSASRDDREDNAVILAGRLFSVAKKPIEDGPSLVIKDGKIVAVGPRASVKIPADIPGDLGRVGHAGIDRRKQHRAAFGRVQHCRRSGCRTSVRIRTRPSFACSMRSIRASRCCGFCWSRESRSCTPVRDATTSSPA